jgi:MFS family permease
MSADTASEDPDEPPLLTRDFALLLALQLAFGFAFSSFFLLPKYVVTELSGTAGQVGYVGALAVVTAIVTAPIAGKLLARGPRRPMVLLGSAVTLLTSLAFLWVSGLDGYLYLVRAAQGVGFTLFFVGTVTLVADLAPAARLGQALGWFGSAALLMNAVATLVAERIAHDYGWRGVFLSSAGAGLVTTALALALREPRGSASVPAATASGETDTYQALRSRGPVLWAALAGGAAFGVMFTFTQPFALALGDTHVGPLFAGYTATALLVRLAFGSLADRLGRARVGAAGLAFYSLVVAVTAWLQPGWLWALGLAFGLAHGAFYPSLNALALEGATHAQRGTITAYFIAAFNAGVLVVTFGLGQVAEAYGYPTLFLLVAVLTASGCPLLLGQMRRKAWLVPPIRD